MPYTNSNLSTHGIRISRRNWYARNYGWNQLRSFLRPLSDMPRQTRACGLSSWQRMNAGFFKLCPECRASVATVRPASVTKAGRPARYVCEVCYGRIKAIQKIAFKKQHTQLVRQFRPASA